MKKLQLSPLLAILLLATGLSSAQIGRQPVKANIPFDFMAGKTSLPAGEYTVAALSDMGPLSVSADGAGRAMVNSHAVQISAPSEQTKLIFHRYGDQYFLYQVWIQGENRGRELPQSKLEKELASNIRFSSIAVLAHK